MSRLNLRMRTVRNRAYLCRNNSHPTRLSQKDWLCFAYIDTAHWAARRALLAQAISARAAKGVSTRKNETVDIALLANGA